MQDIDQLSFLGQSMLDQSIVSGFGGQIGKNTPTTIFTNSFLCSSERVGGCGATPQGNLKRLRTLTGTY